jgi:hypothetical protein
MLNISLAARAIEASTEMWALLIFVLIQFYRKSRWFPSGSYSNSNKIGKIIESQSKLKYL